MSERKVILKTEALSYVYGVDTPFEKVALDNIDLEIYENDFMAVIGQTGSGKSTLVQHFNALNKPSSGKLYYEGNDVWEKNYDRRSLRFNVGMVFQYPEHQLFEETVRKDIAYGPSNMGLSAEETDKRVREALEFVGLDQSLLDRSPFELSGGQKRRVAIAGIMAMRPDVLVLDEPAAGLDPRGKNMILGGIRSYQRKTGSTVVMVSHSMEDMANYCDELIVMAGAGKTMQGSADEVFSHARELAEIGLDIPQITKLMEIIKKSGVDINSGVYTVDAAYEEIIKLFKK